MDANTKLGDVIAEYADKKLLEWYQTGKCARCAKPLIPSMEFQVVMIVGGKTNAILRLCSPQCLAEWSSSFSALSMPMLRELAAKRRKT